MAPFRKVLDGHIPLEVECLDRLYLNAYVGELAIGPGLMMFMRGQLGKPIPSLSKTVAEREGIPLYQFRHKERKDPIANRFRRQRQARKELHSSA